MQQATQIKKDQAFFLYYILRPYLMLKQKVTDIKKEMPFLSADEIDEETISELIQKLELGECFGFTLNDFGKSRTALEWAYTLDAIGNWDGTLQALQQKICLGSSRKEVALGVLFEETMNDLVLNQADNPDITHDQWQFLVPATNKNRDDLLCFEVLNKDNQPLFFNSRAVIGGNFSTQDLEKLLPGREENEAQPRQILYQINFSSAHDIRVEYLADLKAWRLYDSNDDHTPIPCYFAYTSQAPDNSFLPKKHASYVLYENTLYYYFPQSLALVVIPLNEQQVSNLIDVYKNNQEKNQNAALTCAELIAIRQITEHQHYTHGQFFDKKTDCAEKILDLSIKHAKNSSSSYLVITRASFASHPLTNFNFELEARHIKNGGLHGIVRNEESLKKILQQAKVDTTSAEALAQALPLQDKDSWNALQMIVFYSCSSLPELFNLAKNNDAIAHALAKALPLQNKDNWTALHIIADYAPSSLPYLFNLAQNNNAIANALAQALPLQDNGGWTGAHAIAWYAPAELENALKIIPPKMLLDKVLATGNRMFPTDTTEKYSCQWLKLHQDTIIFYLKAMKKQAQSTQQEKKSSSFEFENILNELIRKIIAIPTTDSDKFLAEIAHIFALVKSKIEVFRNGSVDKTTAPKFFKPVSASMSDLLNPLLDKILSELKLNFDPIKNSAIYYEGEIESRKMGLTVGGD